MACHLKIAKDGEIKSWRFTRAKVRIAANIAYEDAQAAMDAAERRACRSRLARLLHAAESKGAVPQELVDKALKPLWACWRALFAARQKRDPLELDLPERRVVLDEKGRITSIAPRDRLDAHRLVEDFMIAANVAAARALEAKKAPVMYRVHEPPSREKLVALKDYLATFGVEFALGQVVKPGTFNRIIERVGDARGPRGDHGAIAPHPDAGALRARAARPFRPGACDLCAFHVADPPLRRPAGPSRAGQRLPARRRRPAAGRGRAVRADRRADLDARAAGDGGGARDGRPLRRGLSCGPGRPAGRMPDHAACSRSASSRRSRTSAATGWCWQRTSARNISATTRRRERWSARRAARPTAWGSG